MGKDRTPNRAPAPRAARRRNEHMKGDKLVFAEVDSLIIFYVYFFYVHKHFSSVAES